MEEEMEAFDSSEREAQRSEQKVWKPSKEESTYRRYLR